MNNNIYALASALSFVVATQAFAESDNTTTDVFTPIVVLGNRTEQNIEDLSSSLTQFDGNQLNEEGIFTFRDALDLSPGVYSLSTAGQRGQTGSLFIRGTRTSQSNIRVDGMRISDSNILSGNFLAQQSISSSDNLEILRGPQSALYGGEAIGGVVSLSTKRGTGDPSTSLFLEGGSFNSFLGKLQTQGSSGDFSWNLSIQQEQTENDPAPNDIQDYDRFGLSLRLDYDINDLLTVGATARFSESEFDSTLQFPAFGFSPTTEEVGNFDTDTALATVFAELQASELWSTRLQLGLYEEDFRSTTITTDPTGTITGETINDITTQKLSIEWQNTLEWSEELKTITGFVFEHSELDQDQVLSFPAFSFSSSAQIDRDEDLYGFYLNQLWSPVDGLNLSAGVRWEDYESWGDITTWRTTGSYRIAPIGTTIIASAGRAFRAPSFQEIFGFGSEPGNATIQPEISEGFEFGIRQELGSNIQISSTWFRNNIKDAIRDPFGAAPVNLPGISRTSGIESTLSWKDIAGLPLTLEANWTRLFDEFIGLPENTASAHIRYEMNDRLNVGLGASYVGGRDFGGNDLDRYVVARAFANYRINDHFKLSGRIENIFDRDYELLSFDGDAQRPGAGLGAYIGASLSW